jgi:hypothetical protein
MLWTENGGPGPGGGKDLARREVRRSVFRILIVRFNWRGRAHRAQAGVIITAKFLAGNLPGYVGYQNKVRYRLIPLVW